MTYDPHSVSTRLTRFSLNRRVTVFVLFLSVLVVGAISMRGIPLELFPKGFQGQWLQVRVPWRNAPTQEVLEKVTMPLEEELSTVRGLDGMTSYSRVGNASVSLRFKNKTDMSVAYREVRDRVERAKLLFPSDIDKVYIRKEDASGIPVSVIGVAYDGSVNDTYKLIEEGIARQLQRIDGVATVQVQGQEEKEILIEVDKELAEANNLNIYALAQTLGQDNFSMASGHIRDSGKKYLLRSLARYTSLKELENKMLSPTVRLKDIAVIKYEEAEKRYFLKVNSKPAVALMVMKEGQANTVEVSRRIRETLEVLKKSPRLQGFQIEEIFNQGSAVEESLGNLVDGGKIGGLLAALVLFIFLRRFRLTMIIALSIPLSLLISMVVMFFARESLNIISMLGLVICVGLLVDNSVVVGENIFRLHREGLSRRQACIRGASEIAMAITMATLTTVIVFLPVSLVSGQGQFFLIRLAMPISVSLIASLLIALVFIPLSVYLVLPRRQEHHRFGHFNVLHRKMNAVLRSFYDVTFGNINHFYNKTLAFFLNYRLDLVFIILAVFGLTKWLVFDELEVVDAQEEDQTHFQIHVSASNEYNFDDVKAFFQDCEKVLEQKKDEFGLTGYMVLAFSRGGRLEGWLPRGKKKTLSATQVCKSIAEALPKKPGMKLFYGEDNGMKEEKRRSVYVLRLQGEDAEKLDRVARDMEPLFLSVKGVLGIKKTQDDTPSELAMVVDREKAAENNVNPDYIAGVISYAIMGSSLPKYNDAGRQIPVRIRYKEENRESLADLKNFLVPSNDGNFLPLANLTKTRMLATRRGVFRRDKKVTHSMTFELDEKDTRAIRSRLDRLKNQVDLPEGMFFGAERRVQMNDDIEGMQFAGMISILFIYLLMGFLFESFILPLSIILTIPLAGLGVVWIHFLTGKNLDFLGVVGMILLIGVVVNNGIVLIDYVNRLRADGMERSKAILKAADRRFRPIVMTALTTIIGMIPLTVSQPNSLGISYRSFGLTLIGGMTSATILTLLVVPVFYTMFDDARLLFTETLKSSLRGKGRIEKDKTESLSGVSEPQ